MAGVGAGDHIQTRDVRHPGKDVLGGGGAAGIRQTWQVKGEYAVEGGGGLLPWAEPVAEVVMTAPLLAVSVKVEAKGRRETRRQVRQRPGLD